jgi:hypothetical protein
MIDEDSMKYHYVKWDTRLEISSTRKGIILINQGYSRNLCISHVTLYRESYSALPSLYKWSDNKVRELATLCLLWQHYTKALVCFGNVDISAFHSCFVVVDLWQSLSEWHLLLSACVVIYCRENVGA